MAIKTGSGSTTLGHREIAAHGLARVQLVIVVALAIVFVLLAITYVILRVRGIDAPDLLALIGTAFGLSAGIALGKRTA